MKIIDILKNEPFNIKTKEIKARIVNGTIEVNGIKANEETEVNINGVIESFPDWFCKNFTKDQMTFCHFSYNNLETMFDKFDVFNEVTMNKLPILRDVQYKLNLLKISKGTYYVIS